LLRVRCGLGHAAQQKDELDRAIELLTPVADADEAKEVYSLLRATAAFEIALCHYKKEDPATALEK